MAKTDYASVDEYLAAQPKPTRAALERVRATIRKALPGVTEGISYQIPVFRLDGIMVLYCAGYPHHYSIYPVTTRLIGALKNELAGLVHGKATIRLELDEPVPTRLIARIAKLRAVEAAERAMAKTTKKAPSKKAASKKTASKEPKSPTRKTPLKRAVKGRTG